MIVILPETKGITLERMDKIFGEIDMVEAAENELDTAKQEENVIQHALGEEVRDGDEKGELRKRAEVSHVEAVEKEVEAA